MWRRCAWAMLVVLGLARAAAAASSTLVISQVYGGGGNVGATYKNDFIEIFNLGTTQVDVNGWSVQYHAATATANAWSVTALGAHTVDPGNTSWSSWGAEAAAPST